MSSWKRSINVPYPSVWHTFVAKDTESDKLVNYIVQDLPKNRFDEALKFLKDYFVPDEVLLKCNEIHKDEVSVLRLLELWKDDLQQNVSLVCFKEGSDEIVGLNICKVSCLEDPEWRLEKDIKCSQIIDILMYVTKQFNCYEVYNIDKYLSAVGLVVSPKYRGRCISSEILKARFPLCKALAIKVTSTVFTGPISQKAALRAGFVESYSIDYEDLAKVKSIYRFPNIESRACKVMTYEVGL